MSNFSPFQSPDGTETDYGHKLNVSSSHAAAAREKNLSAAAKTPLPLWALVPIVAIGIAGGGYLMGNIAWGPNLHGYNAIPVPPPGVDSGGPPLDPYDPQVWIAKGKGVYGTVCISCHGGTGEGTPGKYPPLKGSEWVIHGEELPVSIVLAGITGPLHVKGAAYGSDPMPAQAGSKSNAEIAQVISYIRNEWGNKASIIYDDQVDGVRKKLGGRNPFNEGELTAIGHETNLPPSKRNAAAAGAAAPAAAGAAAPAPAAAAPAAAPAPAAK